MTGTDTSAEAGLIDYLDQEAEIEIESAQEMTELGKTLRRMETTARRVVRERDSYKARAERAEAALKAVRDRMDQLGGFDGRFKLRKLVDNALAQLDAEPAYNSTKGNQVTKEQIKHMVERFLNWPLPDNFSPDGGVSFEPVGNEGTPHEYRHEPHGTNLLDYPQAKAMVHHMLEGIGDASEPACPVCGCEERGQGGYLSCECPAKPAGVSEPAGVKPLEWEITKENGVEYHKAGGFCIHRVVDRFGTGKNWVCHWPGYSERHWFDTLEAAKDAAQADYEQRILALITEGQSDD